MKHFAVSNLKVELAQDIVKSELLVSEDEDFINNFILSEDTLEEYKKAGESGGSVLGDVLLFSGSLAAVAGIHFSFLFQRMISNQLQAQCSSSASEPAWQQRQQRSCHRRSPPLPPSGLAQGWRPSLRPHHQHQSTILSLSSLMLFLQGTARQRNQRISRPGQTNALRHENLQTAAQKISQPHPRDGDDESGIHQLCIGR